MSTSFTAKLSSQQLQLQHGQQAWYDRACIMCVHTPLGQGLQPLSALQCEVEACTGAWEVCSQLWADHRPWHVARLGSMLLAELQ